MWAGVEILQPNLERRLHTDLRFTGTRFAWNSVDRKDAWQRQHMKTGFRIDDSDNVATLLSDAGREEIEILGAVLDGPIFCSEPVRFGHKVAVREIAAGADVIKYGVVIGKATRAIRPGEWVHLHNCRSRLDERSSTLDVHTGSTQDVNYE